MHYSSHSQKLSRSHVGLGCLKDSKLRPLLFYAMDASFKYSGTLERIRDRLWRNAGWHPERKTGTGPHHWRPASFMVLSSIRRPKSSTHHLSKLFIGETDAVGHRPEWMSIVVEKTLVGSTESSDCPRACSRPLNPILKPR